MSENNTSNGIRNLLIIFIIFIIVGFGLFIIYEAKVKSNDTPSNINTPSNNTNVNTNGLTDEEAIQKAKEELLKQNNIISEEENSNAVWWITGIIVFILIGGIFLYFYYFKHKDDDNKGIKQPVPINRVKEIFKEIISKEYGLGWYMEDNKFQLRNDREFYYRDQRVWFHRATGDKFITIEFIVNNGPMYGFHIATIPADKGEKVLWEGEWSIIHKTDMKDYKLLSKTYPVTSLTDKQERQKMYIAEQIASGDLPKDSMERLQIPMSNNNNNNNIARPSLSSPFMGRGQDEEDGLDGLDEEEGITNMSSTQYPKSKTNRYTRRRR